MAFAALGRRLAALTTTTTSSVDKGAIAWDLCQRFIRDRVGGVFFAPLELIPNKDVINRRIVAALDEAKLPVVLLDRDYVKYPGPKQPRFGRHQQSPRRPHDHRSHVRGRLQATGVHFAARFGEHDPCPRGRIRRSVYHAPRPVRRRDDPRMRSVRYGIHSQDTATSTSPMASSAETT